jgi:hypothetical protein
VEEAAHSSTILQTHTAPIPQKSPQTVAVEVAMIYQMYREIINFEICNASVVIFIVMITTTITMPTAYVQQ